MFTLPLSEPGGQLRMRDRQITTKFSNTGIVCTCTHDRSLGYRSTQRNFERQQQSQRCDVSHHRCVGFVSNRSNFRNSRIPLGNFRNSTRIHGGDAPLAAFILLTHTAAAGTSILRSISPVYLRLASFELPLSPVRLFSPVLEYESYSPSGVCPRCERARTLHFGKFWSIIDY